MSYLHHCYVPLTQGTNFFLRKPYNTFSAVTNQRSWHTSNKITSVHSSLVYEVIKQTNQTILFYPKLNMYDKFVSFVCMKISSTLIRINRISFLFQKIHWLVLSASSFMLRATCSVFRTLNPSIGRTALRSPLG